ncbi:MAG: hypothetical protein JNK04_00080 [Myxococcales bacterium]|nr:hypothetical protein [Myxococcales bacterium]
MPNSIMVCLSLLTLTACGGSNPPPAGQPTAVTPDGTQVPLPTEDGELKEGETTIKQKQPNGDEKKIKVEVDDD